MSTSTSLTNYFPTLTAGFVGVGHNYFVKLKYINKFAQMEIPEKLKIGLFHVCHLHLMWQRNKHLNTASVSKNADFIKATLFYHGRFLKKSADDQFSSITKGSICHIKHIYTQPFTIGVDWPKIVCLMEVSTLFCICTYCIFTRYGRIIDSFQSPERQNIQEYNK